MSHSQKHSHHLPRKYSAVDESEIDALLMYGSENDESSASPASRWASNSSHARKSRLRTATEGSIDALASSASEDEDFLDRLEADVSMYSSSSQHTSTVNTLDVPADLSANAATSNGVTAEPTLTQAGPIEGISTADSHQSVPSSSTLAGIGSSFSSGASFASHLHPAASSAAKAVHNHPGAVRLARISREAEDLLAESDSESSDFEASVAQVLHQYEGAAAQHTVSTLPPSQEFSRVSATDAPQPPLELLAPAELKEIERLLQEAEVASQAEQEQLLVISLNDARAAENMGQRHHLNTCVQTDGVNGNADVIMERGDELLRPCNVTVKSAKELVRAVADVTSAGTHSSSLSDDKSLNDAVERPSMAAVLEHAKAVQLDLEENTVRVDVLRGVSTQLQRFKASCRQGAKNSARFSGNNNNNTRTSSGTRGVNGGPGVATALAVCDQLILVGTSRGAVLVFDRSGKLQLVAGHPPGHDGAAAADGAVCSLDASDGSGYVVAGFSSGKLVLWDLTKAAAEVKVNVRNHQNCPVVFVRFFRHDASDLGTVSVDASGAVFISRYSRNLMFFWKTEDFPYLRAGGSHGQVLSLALLSYSDHAARLLPHTLRDRSRALALSAFATTGSGSTAVVSLNQPSRVLLKWPWTNKIRDDRQSQRLTSLTSTTRSGNDVRQVHHSWAWVDLSDFERGNEHRRTFTGDVVGRAVVSPRSAASDRSHSSPAWIAVLARTCDQCLEFCLVTFPTVGVQEQGWSVEFDVNGQALHRQRQASHKTTSDLNVNIWAPFNAPSPVLALQWLGPGSIVFYMAHRLAVYDVRKRTIRESIELIEASPVATSFFCPPETIPALSTGGSSSGPRRIQMRSSELVARRREARRTFENSFRVVANAAATGSGGSASGTGVPEQGESERRIESVSDSDGDSAKAQGKMAGGSTVQHKLYVLSVQGILCVRTQDWEAKIRALLRPPAPVTSATSEKVSPITDTKRSENNVILNGSKDHGDSGDDLLPTISTRMRNMHTAWAKALAIATTHYERCNKHDNEFSPARVELLSLAKRYVTEHMKLSHELNAALQAETRRLVPASPVTRLEDGLLETDPAGNNPADNGAGSDAVAERLRSDSCVSTTEAMAALSTGHAVFAQNVIDFCVAVDIPSKLFSDIYPQMLHETAAVVDAVTVQSADSAASEVDARSNVAFEVDPREPEEAPARIAFIKYLVFAAIGSGLLTDLPAEFLRLACITLRRQSASHSEAECVVDSDVVDDTESGGHRNEALNTMLAQGEMCFLNLRPRGRAHLAAMVDIFKEFELSKAFAFFVSHYSHDYVRPLRMLLSLSGVATLLATMKKHGSTAKFTGRQQYYLGMCLGFVRACFEGRAFPSTVGQDGHGTPRLIAVQRQPMVRAQICSFLFGASSVGGRKVIRDGRSYPADLCTLMLFDLVEVVRILSLFCDQEMAHRNAGDADSAEGVLPPSKSAPPVVVNAQEIASTLVSLMQSSNSTDTPQPFQQLDVSEVGEQELTHAVADAIAFHEWTLQEQSAVYQFIAETGLRVRLRLPATIVVEAFNFFLTVDTPTVGTDASDRRCLQSMFPQHRTLSSSFAEDMVINLLRGYPELASLCTAGKNSSSIKGKFLVSTIVNTESETSAKSQILRLEADGASRLGENTRMQQDCLAALQRRGMWHARVHVHEYAEDFAGAIGVYLEQLPRNIHQLKSHGVAPTASASSDRSASTSQTSDSQQSQAASPLEVFEYITRLARKLLSQQQTVHEQWRQNMERGTEDASSETIETQSSKNTVDAGVAMLRQAVTKQFAKLIALDRDQSSRMIQVLFEGCEDYDADVLQQLGPYPEVCFRFLRRVAGLSPDTGMKISSKVRHKFRPKTVVQLLELLCQFEPMQVHVFLQGLDEEMDVPLEEASRICKKYANEEGEAFLIERMGDSEKALQLIASAANVRLRKFLLRPFPEDTALAKGEAGRVLASPLFSEDGQLRAFLDRLLGYTLSLDTCRRSSARALKQNRLVNRGKGQGHSTEQPGQSGGRSTQSDDRMHRLWSFFFKTFHECGVSVRQEEQNCRQRLEQRRTTLGTAGGTNVLRETSVPTVESNKMVVLERSRQMVLEFVNAIIAEMLVFLPQRVALDLVFRHCTHSAFGELRPSISELFSTSHHQSTLFRSVLRIMRHDIDHTRRKAQGIRGAGFRVRGSALREAVGGQISPKETPFNEASDASSPHASKHEPVVLCMRSGECFLAPSTGLGKFLRAKADRAARRQDAESLTQIATAARQLAAKRLQSVYTRLQPGRHSTTDLPRTQALGLHSWKQIHKKRLLNSTPAGEVDVQLLTDVLGPTPALNRAKGSERAAQNPFDDGDPGTNQNPFDADSGDEDDNTTTVHGAGEYRPSTESRTLFGRSVAVARLDLDIPPDGSVSNRRD